jgi:5'-nucleotidase
VEVIVAAHCDDTSLLTPIHLGDVFNPSLLSTLTKGKHVPPLLRLLNVSVSVSGNHDYDQSLEVFASLAKSCGTWLSSNILPQIGGTVPYLILTLNGVRVAFVGIAGTDFLGTLNFDASHMQFEDPVDCAVRLAAVLRPQGGLCLFEWGDLQSNF